MDLRYFSSYISRISKEITELAFGEESAARAATDKFAAFCILPPVFGGLIEESSDSPASAPQVPWYANSVRLPPLHGVRASVVKPTGTKEAING